MHPFLTAFLLTACALYMFRLLCANLGCTACGFFFLALSCSLVFSVCPRFLLIVILQPLQKLNNTAFVFTVLFAAGHYMVIIQT